MNKKINYNSIAYLIISIFPILLITGPFLSDTFCIILGLIFVIFNFQNKNWKIFFTDFKPYIYFFLIFYIYLNIYLFLSFDPKISFKSSIPFFRIILFIFALALFTSTLNKTYKGFYLFFLFCISFLLLDSLIQYFFEVNIFRNADVHKNRISSFFGDELIMGSYVSRLLPIILGCSILINLKNKYLINLLIIFISGFLIAISGERLASFYYIGTILVYFILVKKYFLTFISIILISISIGLALNIFSLKTSFIDRFYTNTLNQFNEIGSIYSYRHTLHYKTAYEMFLDKKIFGNGLKSFRYKCSDAKYESIIKKKQDKDYIDLISKDEKYKYLFNDNKKIDIEKINESETRYRYIFEFKNGCNTHPHNIYLEYLSELGSLGFILLNLIFVYAFIKLLLIVFKNFFLKSVGEIELAKSMLLTGILLQLFPLVPSGSYFNNWMLIVFHLSIGFYLSLVKIK